MFTSATNINMPGFARDTAVLNRDIVLKGSRGKLYGNLSLKRYTYFCFNLGLWNTNDSRQPVLHKGWLTRDVAHRE